MKIGYKVFGKNSLNYGLAYCMYKNDIKADSVTENTASCYDAVLFSIFWWQHVYDFFDFCNKAGIGKNSKSKTRVIVGGFNSFNPVIFKNYAHAVCCGDGESVISNILSDKNHPSVYTGTEKEVLYNQDDVSGNKFIYCNEAKIDRIEIARGCKFHCKFCQLSALKKYREVDVACIEKMIAVSKNKRLSLFAPNKTSHSGFEKIVEIVKKNNKLDLSPDVRFNDVEKFYSNGTIQIGIEGISQRLRYSVGKTFSNDRLKEVIKFIVEKAITQDQKPRLHCGFILDLPTETDEDWVEFKAVLDDLQSVNNVDKLCIFFVFNLFMPSPFTVFEDEPINYHRDYKSKIKLALSDNRKFAVNVSGRLFSNYNRILSMIATRGDESTSDIANDIDKYIAKDISDNKKILPLKLILKKFGGIERFVGVPKQKPWEIVKV